MGGNGLRRSGLVVTMMTALAIGCSSETTDTPIAGGADWQVRIQTTIEPGTETERCQFFVVPEGGLWIQREASQMGAGVHHLLLWTSRYDTIPTENNRGEPVDTSREFDCPTGPNATWDLGAVAGGQQSPGSAELIDLPEGVAYRLEPGVVMLNAHVINTTGDPLAVDASIDMFAVPEADVTDEAGVTFWYNYFIKVPARASASARMRCPVPSDVSLVNAQSHMHRRGRTYSADVLDPSGAVLERLYEHEMGFQSVPVSQWGVGEKTLAAGTSIEFTCGYDNAEDRTVYQGPTSADEMCMFFSAYYPRDRAFEWCTPEALVDGPPSFGGTFFGTGTASCGEALTCLRGAHIDGPSSPELEDCVTSTCPAVAPQISAAVTCMMWSRFTTCETACAAPSEDGSDPCGDCVIGECGEQIGACIGASCG